MKKRVKKQSKVMTTQQRSDLAWKIESEGFDYFFTSYCDPEYLKAEYDAPDEVVEKARSYVKASQELNASLEKYGITEDAVYAEENPPR